MGGHSDASARVKEAKGLDLWLLFLVIGTLGAFVIFGMAQEAVTRTKFGEGEKTEQFKFTTFLVLLQSAGNAVVAAVLIVAKDGSATRLSAGVPIKEWLIVAVAYAGAHKFGLWSLLYIPFPLQVLLKSCKTIPVMIGEVVLDKSKTPSRKQIISVLVLTVGIGTFMVFKPSKKDKGDGSFELNEDAIFGMGLVVLALVCDAIYGPYQNRIVSDAKAKLKADPDNAQPAPTAYHLMFNMNFYQGIVALLMLAAHTAYDIAENGGDVAAAVRSSELVEVMAFMSRHSEIIMVFAQFSLAMALGNCFIYSLQRNYGALTVTTTTTLRKFLSVLGSSLPKDGVCKYLPVLPDGLCGLASFPGCALLSCTSLSGFGNEIVPVQWVGVALVVLSKNIAGWVDGALPKAKKE